MVKKAVSPNTETAQKTLSELWASVLIEADDPIDPQIDSLVNSDSVSIRFCLPTQLLGKLVDPKLDCLCLQKGTCDSESTWDPRGFAAKVIVPWVMANQAVLGTSSDPYVSKPLRKPKIEESPGNVKSKADWSLLYQVLHEVENRHNLKFTRQKLILVLRSIKKKLAESVFEYAIPERVGLDQTRNLIRQFLDESSGGDRGLSVAAALFQTFGEFFGLYSNVRRYVINASDQSTGSVADIECLDKDGELRLAIEVKERSLTLTDVKGAVQKARKGSIQEFLFNAPRVNPNDSDSVADLFSRSWASGTNLYQLSIDELINVGLTLTGEDGSKHFLNGVGNQLNEYNTQPRNRQRWKELLEQI